MKKTLSLLLVLAAAAFAQFPGPPASYPAVASDTLNTGAKMLWQIPPFTGTAKLRSMTYAELQSGIGTDTSLPINAKAIVSGGGGGLYTTFGNSLCKEPHPAWTDSIKVKLNVTLQNNCVGGARMEDDSIIGRIYRRNPAIGQVYALEVTGNDITDSIAAADFVRVYAAGIAWLGKPNNQKRFADSVTASGTWSSGSVYGVPYKSSTTAGDYVEFRVAGRYAVIGSQISTTGGNFAITVNGVSAGTYNGVMTAPMKISLYGGPFTVRPSAFVIGPMPNDSNTIRLTLTGSGTRYFSYVYGLTRGENFPRIFSHGCIPRPVYNSFKIALCSTYSSVMDSTRNVFIAAGLPLQATSTINVPFATGFQGDNLHLSASGSQQVADTMANLFRNGTVQQAIDFFGAYPTTNPFKKIAVGGGDTATMKFPNSVLQTSCDSAGSCGQEMLGFVNSTTDIYPSYRIWGSYGTPASPTPITTSRAVSAPFGGFAAAVQTTTSTTEAAVISATFAATAFGNIGPANRAVGWKITGTPGGATAPTAWIDFLDGQMAASRGPNSKSIGSYPAFVGSESNEPFYAFNAYWNVATSEFRLGNGSTAAGGDKGAAIKYNVKSNRMYFLTSRDSGNFGATVVWDTSAYATKKTFFTPYLYARDSAFVGKLTVMGVSSAVLNMSRGSSSDNEHVHFQTLGVDKWLLGMNGSTEVFTLYNSSNALNALSVTTGGNLSIYGTIKTAAPTASTAVEWKFGTLVENACILDAGAYATVEVGGVPRKVALCQ